jgi:hypothetical protein
MLIPVRRRYRAKNRILAKNISLLIVPQNCVFEQGAEINQRIIPRYCVPMLETPNWVSIENYFLPDNNKKGSRP